MTSSQGRREIQLDPLRGERHLKKLMLNLDDLQVETFHTVPDAAAAADGTVAAYISPGPGNTCDAGCTNSTCGATCPDTCGSTCDDPTCSGSCASCFYTCSNTCGSTCGAACGATCPSFGCDTSFACFVCTNNGC